MTSAGPGSFGRDNNFIPITWAGLTTVDTQVLTGNNTTVPVPIFTVTGAIEVTALYAFVGTALGSNITAAFWRTNDGSTQNAITLATGTTISSAISGSFLAKKAGVGTALSYVAGTSGQVNESTTAGAYFFQDFIIQANPLATTNIEFVYSTTNTPTVGSLHFNIRWVPLVPGSTVVGL